MLMNILKWTNYLGAGIAFFLVPYAVSQKDWAMAWLQIALMIFFWAVARIVSKF